MNRLPFQGNSLRNFIWMFELIAAVRLSVQAAHCSEGRVVLRVFAAHADEILTSACPYFKAAVRQPLSWCTVFSSAVSWQLKHPRKDSDTSGRSEARTVEEV